MTRIYFDIETQALPEADILPLAPEFVAPSNYKDPEKIKANIEEQRKAWVEKAALSPITGKVIAIGYLNHGGPMLRIKPDHEKELLIEFWDTMNDEWDRATWVGFNCKRFDLPFLIRRSWKLGVKVHPLVMRGRYFDDCIIDLYEKWQLGDHQASISLYTLAAYLGIGSKSGNGKDFANLPRDKQEEYLANDLELTAKAAERML